MVAQSATDVAPLPGLDQMDESASSLWASTAMHKPLLVPAAFQSTVSHLTEHPRSLRPTESGEANLSMRVVIRAPRARWRAHSGKNKERHEIRLIEHVNVSPGGEVPPRMLEAQLRIKLVNKTCTTAVLDRQPGAEVGHVVDAR